MYAVEQVLCGVYLFCRGDRVFAVTLCKYDLRKCDLFVLSWGMV